MYDVIIRPAKPRETERIRPIRGRVPHISFFSKIPSDTIQRVILFFLEGRKNVLSVKNEAPRGCTIPDLFVNPVSPLGKETLHLFKTIHFGTEDDVVFNFEENSIRIGAACCWDYCEKVLKWIGSSIEEITFDDSIQKFLLDKESRDAFGFKIRNIYLDDEYVSFFCHLILNYCGEKLTKITFLVFVAMDAAMNGICGCLNKFRFGLGTLSIVGEGIPAQHANSFSRAVTKCTNLEKFSMTTKFYYPCIRMWMALGKVIRSCTLDFEERYDQTWAKALHLLQRSCPNLKEVAFGSDFPQSKHGKDYVSFLKAYGNNLIAAPLGCLCPRYLKEIYTISPNLKLKSFKLKDGFNRLELMSDFLEELEIQAARTQNLSIISFGVSFCKKLTSLDLRRDHELLTAYESTKIGVVKFHNPMGSLKKLILQNCVTYPEFTRLISQCSPQVINIEVVLIGAISGNTNFDKTSKEIPKIEHLSIIEGIPLPTDDPEFTLVGRSDLFRKMAKSFSACKYLNELHVYVDITNAGLNLGRPNDERKRQFLQDSKPLRGRGVVFSFDDGISEMTLNNCG